MRRSCRWVMLVLLLGADLLYAQSRPDPYEKARNSIRKLIILFISLWCIINVKI